MTVLLLLGLVVAVINASLALVPAGSVPKGAPVPLKGRDKDEFLAAGLGA
ncbi:hypothetical protein [Methylobacterium isbiliense]|jgi:hypothetical protein|uniref:Uncharacterized protein n=1 Tax=Methylobacterium isbiliense TaxID=315478 RepID=A0ABQ4S5A3_9HYPH|nr:hypothetical protein [Methylobacterium isbiliense]MDN3623245.1 hypothetical protein [Methylobacterium isbiliense]GJD98316.1 hypothetical protein GMJLKIPL_0223 [Methylobacterium isbiliense]